MGQNTFKMTHRFWQIVKELGETWDYTRKADEMYAEAADIYAKEQNKKFSYQLHQKIFTAFYDLWRLVQRKMNNHPEMFSELDIKRINNNKAIMDANMPPFDATQILRKS